LLTLHAKIHSVQPLGVRPVDSNVKTDYNTHCYGCIHHSAGQLYQKLLWSTYTFLHVCEYDMTYLLTAIGLPPGGSSTAHIYTQTIHRTTQNKQYIEQHNNFGRVQAVHHLGKLYPGICLTTEEKAQKNLSQGS
jgi:hypothetical protein